MGKSHPTSKRRREKQQLKERYAKTREDAQLAGLIHTTPEGAVRNEVSTGNAQLPELVRQAIRESWATPDAAKAAIVANLLEPFFAERETDPVTGKLVPPNRGQMIELAKTLRLLDQTQFERDHPEEAGMAKGSISLTNVMQATATMRESLGDIDQIMALTQQCFETPGIPVESDPEVVADSDPS